MSLDIEERVGKTIDLTMQLGKIPSLSGQEKAAANFAAEQLSKIRGVSVCRVGGGVIAIAQGEGDHTVVQVGIAHLDQVPLEGGLRPLRRTEEKIIGPGAGDNKVGVAVAIVDLQYPAEQDRIVVLSPEEELHTKSEGRGAPVQNAWLLEHVLPRYDSTRIGGINYEPTYRNGENGFVGFGHRGGDNFRVIAEGPSFHAARSSRGKDVATVTLGRILSEQERIQVRWTELYSDEFGEPTFNVVGMEAHVANNVVPGSGSVTVAVRSTDRLFHGWDEEREFLNKTYGVRFVPETSPDLAVSTCDPQTRIYKTMEATGVPIAVFPFASDQGFFSFPVVHYGPGNVDDGVIHTPNDSVHIEAVKDFWRNLVRAQQIFPSMRSTN